jgi:hypothetical protein
MKTCPGCRMIHPDDYMGSCPQCGKGMGDVSVGGKAGGPSLEARFSRQARGYGDQNTTRVDESSISKDRVAAVRQIIDDEGWLPEEAA